MELSLARLAAEPIKSDFVVAPQPVTEAKPARFGRPRLLVVVAMGAIFALGIFLRLWPTATFSQLGYDEHGYMVFMKHIETAGLTNYDSVVRVFMERQYKRSDALVPATRVGFLAPAYLCGKLLHLSTFRALQVTAGIASSLLLLVAAVFAYRMGGTNAMLGTTLLVATAPLQIQLAQHTFIDACFSFWAVAVLWLLWENLQQPRRWVWLAAYGAGLTMLVLTKESAAFVVIAIIAVLLFNRIIRIGTATPQLVAATVIGPAIAVFVLLLLMGGVTDFVKFFVMFAAKQRTNPYSIMAQDGAWYRYLIDLTLLSPLVVPLALGRMFNLRRTDSNEVMLTAFLAASFLCMANVKYGVSVRYAAYWELPLAFLACSQVLRLSKQFARVRPAIIGTGLLLVVSVSGLCQYERYFVESSIYDPITPWLIRASDFVK
jgi:4-amino-4-deoxy-L-arabinose transferase-like glycosyltransferase